MFAHAQDWKVQPASHWNLVNIVSSAHKRGNNCRGSKMFLKTFRTFLLQGKQILFRCARKRGNISGNNVSTTMFLSATMLPRVRGPFYSQFSS